MWKWRRFLKLPPPCLTWDGVTDVVMNKHTDLLLHQLKKKKQKSPPCGFSAFLLQALTKPGAKFITTPPFSPQQSRGFVRADADEVIIVIRLKCFLRPEQLFVGPLVLLLHLIPARCQRGCWVQEWIHISICDGNHYLVFLTSYISWF